MHEKAQLLVACIAIIGVQGGCGGGGSGSPNTSTTPVNTTAPSISALEDSTVPNSAAVRILGLNFGLSQGSSTLTLGTASLTVLSWADTEIRFLLPSSASSGNLTVTTSAGQASRALAISAAKTLFVSTTGNNSQGGTMGAPLATVQEALNLAQAGDHILLRGGSYDQAFTTTRAGGSTVGTKIVLAAFPGESVTFAHSGRIATINHSGHTLRDLSFDSLFGVGDCIRTTNANNLSFQRVTIRNVGSSNPSTGAGDGIDIEGGSDLLIEDCEISDCLAGSFTNQIDSHGIVAGNFSNLTIRRTRIFRCSGDCIQFDPDRDPWDNVLIDNCELFTGAMPSNKAGWSLGEIPGENAVDTKVGTANPALHRWTIRDSSLHGFRGGAVSNQAALNIKEETSATVERCTIFDCEIGLRLRFPASITVRNCVVRNNNRGLRYEDGIVNLTVFHGTFIANNQHFFNGGGGGLGTGFQAVNGLFQDAIPSEATSSNLAVSSSNFATTFANAVGNDFRLVSGASAIDTGINIGVTDDHRALSRPRGAGFDIGAFEFDP